MLSEISLHKHNIEEDEEKFFILFFKHNGRRKSMKEYYVVDRGLRWTCKNFDDAKKKALAVNGKVESRACWKYFAPYYTSSTSGYREITGENLIAAIEGNFKQIIQDYDISGCSGYKLNRVSLIKRDEGVELIIDANKLGKMEKIGERILKRIRIEGIEEEDMLVKSFDFLVHKD